MLRTGPRVLPQALIAGKPVVAYDVGGAREVVLPGTIEEVHFLGSVIRLSVNVDGTIVALDTFNRPDQPPPPLGLACEISFAASDVILLPGS